jgi:hypothetical protein
VFLSTLPVALPYLLVGDVRRAEWISTGIAHVLLFVAGYGYRPGRRLSATPDRFQDGSHWKRAGMGHHNARK